MRWEKCQLIANAESGSTDELGNRSFVKTVTADTFCRISELTAKDLKIYERTVSDKTLKFLLRIPFAETQGCDYIRLNNTEYSIVETAPSGRFTICFCDKKGKS